MLTTRAVERDEQAGAGRYQTGRLRVLLVFYADSPDSGGAYRVGELLSGQLSNLGVDVHAVFAYGTPGPISAAGRTRCHFVAGSGPTDPGAWLRARRLIRAIKPDLVHFVNPVFWIASALAGTPQPKLLHVHGPMSPDTAGSREKFVWQGFRRLMDGHICVSREMEQKLLSAKWGRAESTATIYNAIDCARFATLHRKSDARARIGVSDDVILLSMICRLVHEKGCDDAIRLLPTLPAHYHLALAGDGPERPALESQASALGVRQRTHFLGFVAEPLAIYSTADYLLFMSRAEPFGLVLGEAMAAGVPIVGLAGEGGYREAPRPLVKQDTAWLIDRKPGELFGQASDATLQGLSTTIQRLSGSQIESANVTRRAQEWVRAHFDARSQAETMLAFYQEVIARKASSK